jgi:hypothetical protein
MPITYNKIASVTVGSGGAASIDFSSIPATYTDLKFVISSRGTTAANFTQIYATFNGSSAANYGRIYLQGYNSLTESGTNTGQTFMNWSFMNAASSTTSTFSNHSIYIPNYTSSNNKSISIDAVQENNSGEAVMQIIAGLWSNTSVINQITLTAQAGNFAEHSTATLYGIKKD